MDIKSFFKLSQMYSTTASIFPAIIGVLYAWYNYREFHLGLTAIAFVVAILFHMAVNIRDEYLDYVVASNKHSSSVNHMVIGQEKLSLPAVRASYYIVGIISALLGFYLVAQTSMLLLYVGIICFLIGIFYTAGPRPISSTPFGEIFSGLAMGFAILFVVVYVNGFNVMVLNAATVGKIFLASLPTVITVTNIMLANNICDLEEDVEDNRFTLPYYIGKPKSLALYKGLYYIAYLSLIVSVFLGIYPKLILLTLFSFPIIQKNINIFMNKQVKEETFITAVQNSAVIPLFMIVSTILGILLNF
ncbi:1,4-dihydroxy-2-naphthoate polyprenyltransferase [Pisciglobus halotolerans]|uniref:1,4-dihydroxy-2-naphthoate octaprenyltransferase n=1 Tax=Pisciglobus halotolerans TaxID=745365 RepID=A0A1I3CCF6_9LACT|nr:1,4-dihydroxy-2-naphthoate polyprenyltransferase [Pisciglobus halotolerans]SFH72222.1 1,4-dihydroxy-2-naphthoate octaprenyltransferase [Pisciglobus halotolerans]